MRISGFEIGAGSPTPLGATATADGCNFAVYSSNAERIEVCLFDASGDHELQRLTLPDRHGDIRCGFIPGLAAGSRYGFRAHGPFDPSRGHRFDPAKLLVDPYALTLDRPFAFSPDLCLPPDRAVDTAALVPKAIVTKLAPEVVPAKAGIPTAASARRAAGAGADFVYELNVRAFTQRHPDVPIDRRGTLAGLREPAIVGHLRRLGVTAVELMPIAAWVDERHLPPLGLANAWGYNPITMMALDPRLAPGGLADLTDTVETLHAAGIEVVLDVVFNHSGESDVLGPTLSFRGLDNASYYRLDAAEPSRYVNDTGCGNTLALDRGPALRLTLDTLRLLAGLCGIDGFRFDLATVLGRTPGGYDRDAPLLAAIEADPLLSTRRMIAEPWDIGPGGYQLGGFPPRWSEWNDRYRDDVRRFWRGDDGGRQSLATRLSGSADIFPAPRRRPSASINFVASHDGMTLRDTVSYAEKHNAANGEDNRDGTNENYSWNNGSEGASPDPAIRDARDRDVRALLATLFLSRGTPMLTAGDEFGRSQQGNNNAYAQNNDLTFLDWSAADRTLITFVERLARLRGDLISLLPDKQASGDVDPATGLRDVSWIDADGEPLVADGWQQASPLLGLVLTDPSSVAAPHGIVWFCADRNRATEVHLPRSPNGDGWQVAFDSSGELAEGYRPGDRLALPARSVVLLLSKRTAGTPERRTLPANVDRLAEAVGLQPDWWSINGERTGVPVSTKIALLESMGLPAATDGDARDSLVALTRERLTRRLPSYLVQRGGGPIELPIRFPSAAGLRAIRLEIDSGDGGTTIVEPPLDRLRWRRHFDVLGTGTDEAVLLLPPQKFGRHKLILGDEADAACQLICAPETCYLAADLAPDRRVFGITAHLYSLRHDGDFGIGDFETLARAGEAAGAAGAALLGINPLHHLYPADRGRRSPYHPSDRRFLDPIHIDVAAVVDEFGGEASRRQLSLAMGDLGRLTTPGFVDYEGVWALKLRLLETSFADFSKSAKSPAADEFEAFRSAAGDALRRHGEHQLRTAYAGADAAFPGFLQWIAERQLARAAARAGAAGLPLGLYRDLAVGVAPDAGEVAADPDQFMTGASIGAPPDPFSAGGQVWNLPPFNPLSLERSGAAAFAEIVEANMRHAGVLRVDHILGLSRLFLVPDGAPAAAGAYLSQPADLLFAILAEASHRHRTTVIGEDLGTVPDGFATRLRREQILSYRVLWFERDGAGFRAPADYPAAAAACLSTHDLPTLRGWIAGRDIEIDQAIGRIDAETAAARNAQRSGELAELTEFARQEGDGETESGEPDSLAAAIHARLAGGCSVLMLTQVDDLAGETEPLNVPGTDREWPNWGRRIGRPIETLLQSPQAHRILAAIKRARARAAGSAPEALQDRLGKGEVVR